MTVKTELVIDEVKWFGWCGCGVIISSTHPKVVEFKPYEVCPNCRNGISLNHELSEEGQRIKGIIKNEKSKEQHCS